jgi:hypothetical protein
MEIPEIVKEYVLKTCIRMPETEQEIDQYLDLINHAKQYETSLVISAIISKKMFKKLGFKSPSEIKKEGEKMFSKK